MRAKGIRFLGIIAVAAVLSALPIAAYCAIVLPNVGSISTPPSSGVTGGGNWTSDVTVGWSVSASGDNFLYLYDFQAPTQGSGLSHFILQVSNNFTDENIIEISNEYELGTFDSSQGGSNPGIPGSIFGIKFEGFEDGNGEGLTFGLLSDRAPMLGDFYAKGGQDSFAFNTGFGSETGFKILVPDTEGNGNHKVPEPGTLVILGSGLIGFAAWGRKKFRK